MRPNTLWLALWATAGTLAFTLAACGDDDPTAPAPVQYTASLSPSNERNADGTPATINSTGSGTATFSLAGNDTLTYTITVSNLSSGATASHIHVGGANENGAVVNGFAINAGITSGTLASGTIVLSKLVAAAGQISGDSLRTLLNNGKGYVNVHTSNYKGGEMRGQIVRQ